MMARRAAAAAIALFLSGAAAPARAQFDCTGVSQSQNSTLASVVVASGLTQPLFVTAAPGDKSRIFIVERNGHIKFHTHGQPASTWTTFLDISTKVDSTDDLELGLLGLAFDPSYAGAGGHFWVFYSENVGGQVYSVVARYTTSANPDVADATSESRVLRLLKPQTNHNGGMLMFGQDGFLYVFTGDGGDGGDPHGPCGNGQNLNVLLAKILRLDVRNVDPQALPPDCGAPDGAYGIPSSNPFKDGAGVGVCDEIWAFGVRNPWRPSFDPANGDLYVADVGQDCWEEINWRPGTSLGGENYGWRQMEATHCYNPADTTTCDPAGAVCGSSPACHDPGLTLPVLEYSHAGACSITGGYVYRGCRMPNMRGKYFYGDFCGGFVRSLVMSGGAATNLVDFTSQVDPGGTLPGNMSSFGIDAQGEEYITSLAGSVRKLVPPFTSLEVSGLGAADKLLLSRNGPWTWENLFASTDVPVSFYRVYRGTPGGSYTCILKISTPTWPAGDTVNPSIGQMFAYVVTAINASNVETLRGTTGTFNASTCP